MRKPDYEGLQAKIWKITWSDGRKASTASLAHYLIQGPFHPMWHQWVFGMVSLADIEGIPPAKKHFPDATHEIMIISCDPKFKLDPDVILDKPWMLQPFDVVQHFKVPSDDDAKKLAEECIKAIRDGHMSPDQDFRSAWKKVITNTADHFYGKHESCKH